MNKLTDEQKKACREAAEYISQHGHHKGNYFGESYYISQHGHHKGNYFGESYDEEGEGRCYTYDMIATSKTLNPPACALGAIAKVTGQDVELARREYGSLLAGMLGDLMPEGENGFQLGVQHWNDEPDTTAEDVILKLKEWGNS